MGLVQKIKELVPREVEREYLLDTVGRDLVEAVQRVNQECDILAGIEEEMAKKVPRTSSNPSFSLLQTRLQQLLKDAEISHSALSTSANDVDARNLEEEISRHPNAERRLSALAPFLTIAKIPEVRGELRQCFVEELENALGRIDVLRRKIDEQERLKRERRELISDVEIKKLITRCEKQRDERLRHERYGALPSSVKLLPSISRRLLPIRKAAERFALPEDSMEE